MLSRLGVEATVFYDGLGTLGPYVAPARAADVLLMARRMVLDGRTLATLRTYDFIVVVNHVPRAYLKSLRVERIRRAAPKTPVVLYDLVYLPSCGPWASWLTNGNTEFGVPAGQHGVERYDWHLCVSAANERAVPEGPQPYSLVGIDLDDGTLSPEQDGHFVALVDFERPSRMAERAIQIQALEDTNTKYVVLHGSYTKADIRRIYRRCSVYFVAHLESFGLPICEVQACGSFVLTPYDRWCQAHWIKDVRQAGPGRLSPNFVVYGNDRVQLIESLTRLKASYDATSVVGTFRREHPQLWRGDETQLRVFVEKVRAGEIHARSHAGYSSTHPA
jgi:hypothetical protein